MEEKELFSITDTQRAFFEEMRFDAQDQVILNENIWNDLGKIPETPPSIGSYEAEGTFVIEGNQVPYYKYVHIILDSYALAYVENVRIKKYSDLYKNVYHLATDDGIEVLKDMITYQKGGNYLYKLTMNGKVVPFGKGNPHVDNRGFIIFEDTSWIKGDLSISFWKYIGRYSGDSTLSAPYPDETKLIYTTESPSNFASLKNRSGVVGTVDYVLPPTTGTYYETNGAENTGVVVLQENLQAIVDHGIIISGGLWEPKA